MFSKFTVFRVFSGMPALSSELAQWLEPKGFVPTSPNQGKSSGFVPPRAEHGAMVEVVAGQWIAALVIETRKVPGDALQRHIDAKVAAIEEATGRKPGRRERAEIKGEAVDELMPQAFPKRTRVPIWFDPAAGLLVVGAASQAVLDDVITLLVQAVHGLQIGRLVTEKSPRMAMGAWMLDADVVPPTFLVGRSCELQSLIEDRSAVKFKNRPLDTDEIHDLLTTAGLVPVALELVFDDRLSFVLSDDLVFRSVEMLEAALLAGKGAADEDAFDADVAIETGTLAPMLVALVAGLGGLSDGDLVDQEAAAAAAAEAAPLVWDDDGADPMIDRARELVVGYQKASISFVQRKLEIGYNRAARLLETLEGEGVVSAMGASGQRSVLVGGAS